MLKPLTHLDIVLSTFNQENLIERVLYGLFKNTTTPFSLIMVFDGCTDKTEERALHYIKRRKPKNMVELLVTHAPNVYETRANNIGFKMAQHDYMITLQDDMVINEYGWERRLTYPLRKFDDVLAVTARAAHDIDHIEGYNHGYLHQKSRELGTLPRDIFAVRDVVNRGPIAFNMSHLRGMNFLNDAYAPSDLDDADLSLRAWKEKKLRVGAYWIDYISRLEWGKTRAKDSTMYVNEPISVNGAKIMKDHGDYLSSKIKHDENILIPENEIDYVSHKNPLMLFYGSLFKPYRLKMIKKEMRLSFEKCFRATRDFSKETVFKMFDILGKKDSRELGIKKTLISFIKK